MVELYAPRQMHIIATRRLPDDLPVGETVETMATTNIVMVVKVNPVRRSCLRPKRRESGRDHSAMKTLIVCKITESMNGCDSPATAKKNVPSTDW